MGINLIFVRFIFIFCLTWLFTGCSTVGSIHKTEEQGRYTISVSSNAFSSAKKREAVFNKKAEKACGTSQYEFVGAAKSAVQKITDYSTSYNHTSSVLNTERIVICKDSYMPKSK